MYAPVYVCMYVHIPHSVMWQGNLCYTCWFVDRLVRQRGWSSFNVNFLSLATGDVNDDVDGCGCPRDPGRQATFSTVLCTISLCAETIVYRIVLLSGILACSGESRFNRIHCSICTNDRSFTSCSWFQGYCVNQPVKALRFTSRMGLFVTLHSYGMHLWLRWSLVCSVDVCVSSLLFTLPKNNPEFFFLSST